MQSPKGWFATLGAEIYQVSSTLLRVMVPVLLLVKLLEELGLVEQIGHLLAPVMGLVGLPESMGLVWATTLLTNIYGGMILFFSLAPEADLTVAQVTVLGSMMLIAHALPVEVRIAQMAGIRPVAMTGLRLGGALLFGALLHQLYRWGGWLQQPNRLQWAPPPVDDSLLGWGIGQLQSLAMVLSIVTLLLTLLKLLRDLGVERLFIWLLQPLMRLLGIGPKATSITIIGLTLGLAFGGALLIREARHGGVPYRDMLASMTLLGLCHSLIEDTLLVLLLGAHISGVLWLRLLFGLLLVGALTRLMRSRDAQFFYRYLLIPEESRS